MYEIRIEFSGNIFRILCCMDEGELVILFNGFQKKTQKTPTREIEKTTRLMNKYFNSKKDEKKIKYDMIIPCNTLDELLYVKYGKPGTPQREEFDKETQAFCLAETLKEERLRAGLTQQQLAERIRTKQAASPVLKMAKQTFI